jgi:cyclic pyranopterin phosphate synthase
MRSMDGNDENAISPVSMVDVSSKPIIHRMAEAEGVIRLTRRSLDALRRGTVKKGNVLATAEVAGILAAKKTHELIPLCHSIPITSVQLKFRLMEDRVEARCKVNSNYKTGVEMDALVGVSAALLTIWDMVKYMEKDGEGLYPNTAIECIRVVKKVKEK